GPFGLVERAVGQDPDPATADDETRPDEAGDDDVDLCAAQHVDDDRRLDLLAAVHDHDQNPRCVLGGAFAHRPIVLVARTILRPSDAIAARILSTLVFWILMIPIIIGSTFIVVAFYLPLVALKAAWLALTGRLHEA